MDDFELLALLGDGGQGKVYRAKKRSTGVEYALKVMHCREQMQLDYALKEVKVLTQLRHSHIVSYIDFFLRLDGGPHLSSNLNTNAKPMMAAMQPPIMPLTQGQNNSSAGGVSVILVMDMCNEGTLADRAAEAKANFLGSGEHCISETRVLRWLRQCAMALMYMHDRGFLHRDVKPSNIFLHRDAVKVGDFGLATPQSKNGATSHVGTPYYLAPELLLRQPYDEKVDVWGLGLTFLELTTLQERPINTEVLESPSRVDSVVHDVTYLGFSPLLGNLIRDMLQRHPAQRPTPRAILERIHVDEPQPERFTVTPPSLPEDHLPQPRVAVTAQAAAPVQRIGTRQVPSAPTSPNKPALGGGKGVPTFESAAERHGDDARAAAPSPAVAMCDMCQVYVASKYCAACDSERYCDACDEVKHNTSRRAAHQRIAVADAPPPIAAIAPRPPARARSSSLEQPTAALQVGAQVASASGAAAQRPRRPAELLNAADLAESAGSASAPASRGNSPVIDPAMAPPRTVYVPSQRYTSVVQALADATPGTTIVVAAGAAYADSIVMRVPGVTLISEGEGDARCRLGDAHLVTITISAPDCRISNFVIAQSLMAAEQTDRPFAVSVSCSGSVIIDRCDIVSVGNCIGISGENTDVSITNCVLRNAKQAGVYAFNGARCSVTGCVISRCEHAGVLLKKRVRAVVSGCTIKDCLGSGIFCVESSGLFERNTIANCANSAIVLKTKAEPVVRGNQIINSGQTGVFCCDRSTGTIKENHITGSGKAGIIIKTAAHPTITKNVVSQGREMGIYVFENGQGHIEENDIRSHVGAGVVVASGGDPRVVRNRIQHNQGEGVWVCQGGRGYFEANDLRNNLRGPKDIAAGEGIKWVQNREA